MMPLNILIALAIFLDSFLLFLIEPILGKQLLPLLGGSAAIWTTCLVFFQTSLLLGYLCAHFFATRIKLRAQSRVYMLILGAAVVQLGATLGYRPTASTAHPVFSVFWLLSMLIGIPFLALSAANPLLQSWYGYTTKRGELVSPFHLFAISNLGSLLALLVYPFVIEPRITLHRQVVAWSLGFLVFVLLCLMIHWSRSFATGHQKSAETDGGTTPGVDERLLWLLLGACGSLLLCAVTNYLSQNVAAVPLLWILPLSVYLLSFIVAFNGQTIWPRWLAFGLLLVALGAAGTTLYKYGETETKLRLAVIPIFCTILFILCLFCHGELYRLRPSARHATSFYLYISAGGAVGAFFVGVVAPSVFSANYELMWGLVLVSGLAAAVSWKRSVPLRLFWSAGTVGLVVLFTVHVRTVRRDTIVRARSFYGALRVTENPIRVGPYRVGPGTVRILYNGTIEHGMQLYGSGWRSLPTTYFGLNSGIGLALRFCCGGAPRRVGVIGLGVGTLAAYGRANDVFRFYEINPLVEDIARNQFSYLSDSRASIQVVLGDARNSLATEVPQQFDVLAVDAFTGDAIPAHLLTTQALELYRRHLKPGGILAVHVTNRYLDLAPVVQQLAAHAGLPSVLVVSGSDSSTAIHRADWVLVSDNTQFFSRPEVAAVGGTYHAKTDLSLWTDDYSSLLPVLRWNSR
jgi:SAM-dependent methyltransferase